MLAEVLDHLGTAGIAAGRGDRPDAARRAAGVDRRPAGRVRGRDGPRSTTRPTARSSRTSPPRSGGRRVYLNRTLVEADFVVVLTGRGYDPLTGYAGAEAAIFPALADEETRAAFAGEFTTDAPAAKPWPVRDEAAEVAWLLGTPFLVQVIEGEGDTVQEVVAGLLDSTRRGRPPAGRPLARHRRRASRTP